MSVFAQSQSISARRTAVTPVASESVADLRSEKVRSDVSKMVAEAKAGRAGPPRNTQFSPPHSNNLSKTAKIAIIVGVVLVIAAIVVWKNFKYECKSRCVI